MLKNDFPDVVKNRSVPCEPFIFGFKFKTRGNFQPGNNVPTGSQNNENGILSLILRRPRSREGSERDRERTRTSENQATEY